MKDKNTLFFEVIRIAIGNQLCLSNTPSADEWGELYAMAKKQSLVGICFADRMCREVTLPLHTRLTNEDVEYVIGNFCEIISK